MIDLSGEYIRYRYDENSAKYIITNKIRSFKEHCTCEGYCKEFIKHEPYCPQQIEVMNWIKEND